jgi:hypothetical protein
MTDRSSTSNSSQRAPEGPWGRTFLLALALAVSVLCVYEAWLRSQGAIGSVTDDLALWALQRERLDRGDLLSTDLVVLGKSRIQLGFDPARYGERSGGRFAQLAIDDRDPLATLEDIAERSDFSGVVLVAVDATSFEPGRHDDQAPWVEYYRSDWRPNPRLNRLVSSTLQARLALLSPLANLLDLFRELYGGRSIRSLYYLETRADRSRAADYERVDTLRAQEVRVSRFTERYIGELPLAPDPWAESVRGVAAHVRAIQERGGAVVFMRLPTAGPLWRLEEERYPRRQYWDRIRDLTGAHTVHFRDHRGFEEIPLPDFSHVDLRDAPAYTDVVLDALMQVGVLPSR